MSEYLDPNPSALTGALDQKLGDDTTEKEYREKLAGKFAAESVGSVGLYTSMDLGSDERAQLDAVSAECNPGNQRENFGKGGWGNYGEADLSARGNFALKDEIKSIFKGERLGFVDREDGRTDILYSFGSNAMIDDTGRPGRTINVSFTLDGPNTAELQAAIERDPVFIHTVVESQLKSLGFSEKRTAQLRPRYDNYSNDAPTGSAMEVSTYDRNSNAYDANGKRFPVTRTKLSLDTHQSLMPESAPVEALADTPETGEPGADAQARAAEYTASLREMGLESREVSDELSDTAYGLQEVMVSGGEDADKAAIGMDAFLAEYDAEVAADIWQHEDPEAYAEEMMQGAIDAYVISAKAAGITRDEVVAPDMYMGDDKSMDRTSFKVSILKDALDKLAVDVSDTKIANALSAGLSHIY